MTYRKDLLKAGTKIFEMRYASCVYELILLMRENVTHREGGNVGKAIRGVGKKKYYMLIIELNLREGGRPTQKVNAN